MLIRGCVTTRTLEREVALWSMLKTRRIGSPTTEKYAFFWEGRRESASDANRCISEYSYFYSVLYTTTV